MCQILLVKNMYETSPYSITCIRTHKRRRSPLNSILKAMAYGYHLFFTLPLHCLRFASSLHQTQIQPRQWQMRRVASTTHTDELSQYLVQSRSDGSGHLYLSDLGWNFRNPCWPRDHAVEQKLSKRIQIQTQWTNTECRKDTNTHYAFLLFKRRTLTLYYGSGVSKHWRNRMPLVCVSSFWLSRVAPWKLLSPEGARSASS